ncbi:MAG: hypothetical protein WBL35_15315 [Ornithinibacter sp.]
MGRRGGAAAFAVLWVLAGLVVWSVGVLGIARGLEDRCLGAADDRGYGATSQSVSAWPPAFTCELTGPDDPAGEDPLEVSQTGVAILRAGWLLGVPVAWLVLGTVVRLRMGDHPSGGSREKRSCSRPRDGR